MAYSVALAERIRQQLARRKNVEEKRMFGGVGFLLNGNMLVGVWKKTLIARPGQQLFPLGPPPDLRIPSPAQLMSELERQWPYVSATGSGCFTLKP
jgi:hypothetical protein